jgi:hypothetical protein
MMWDGLSREQALVDLARILEQVEPGRRQLVLSDAAVTYAQTGGERYTYQVACAELPGVAARSP